MGIIILTVALSLTYSITRHATEREVLYFILPSKASNFVLSGHNKVQQVLDADVTTRLPNSIIGVVRINKLHEIETISL